jgi:hypothetical protein
MSRCGHPLCALVGGACSLATGRSRGCQAPRPAAPFEPALVEEVATLLAQLAPQAAAPEDQRAPATRLAFLFRREARGDRNLLALATDDELEPELAARLTSLCSRTS